MSRVSPLTSQVTFRSQASGAVCGIADFPESLTSYAAASCLSRCARPLCPAFTGFRRMKNVLLHLASRTVPVRSSDHGPSGSLRFTQTRNQPALLDSARSGFLSLLTASFLFRVTDGARTPSEELVNAAPKSQNKSIPEGAGTTSLSRPFPGHPGSS